MSQKRKTNVMQINFWFSQFYRSNVTRFSFQQNVCMETESRFELIVTWGRITVLNLYLDLSKVFVNHQTFYHHIKRELVFLFLLKFAFFCYWSFFVRLKVPRKLKKKKVSWDIYIFLLFEFSSLAAKTKGTDLSVRFSKRQIQSGWMWRFSLEPQGGAV